MCMPRQYDLKEKIIEIKMSVLFMHNRVFQPLTMYKLCSRVHNEQHQLYCETTRHTEVLNTRTVGKRDHIIQT
jgi:hypothetical protein